MEDNWQPKSISDARAIIGLLSRFRFDTEDEKKLQEQIKDVFTKNEVSFQKEFVLDDRNHIDFLVNANIGIEVKIKGGKMNIFRQCERYCEFEMIHSFILVTSKSMGMVKEINGKPIYFLNINKAWL